MEGACLWSRALALSALLAVACRGGGSGEGGDASASDGTGESGGSDDSETDGAPMQPRGCGEQDPVLGAVPLRRLNREQYNNTVRDLLGDTTAPADAFPADDTSSGFAVGGNVSQLIVRHYLDAAELLAQDAIADLDSLLPCVPAGDEDGCAREFVESFVPRAYRRPLDAQEVDGLVAVYDAAKQAYGFEVAIATIVEVVLQSPHFLYRVEIGAPDPTGAVAPLTGPEVASRLSYLLWNTMPDDALLSRAASGELGTPGELEAEARRMLDDPRARDAVASFHRQWIGLDTLGAASKDGALYPNWSVELGGAMVDETERFAQHIVLEGGGDLETLLTAEFGFVNEDLARVYGVAGVVGDELVRRDLPAGQRSGLLTQASVMALLAKPNQTDPVHRGAFVRQQLLCQVLPDPPADADIVPPDPDPDSTTRERFAEHSSDPVCAGCHQLLDPVGFGFEHYDAIGAWRDEDGGRPVDASGELVATADIDGPFDGALELGQLLAGSEEVRECVGTQWFRFAFGRTESEDDRCTQDQIHEAFAAADYDIGELLVGLILSDGFRFKTTEGG